MLTQLFTQNEVLGVNRLLLIYAFYASFLILAGPALISAAFVLQTSRNPVAEARAELTRIDETKKAA